MKKIIYIVVFLLSGIKSYSQNLYSDIQRDWYAAIPQLDVDLPDSIMLYPAKPAAVPKTNIIAWQYKYDYTYQLVIFDNSQPGYTDPIIYAPEKWIIKENKNDKELIMKDTKHQKWFHNTIRTYKLIEYRNNYNLLQSILLIKM